MGFFASILSVLAQEEEDEKIKRKVSSLLKEYVRARAKRKLLIARKFGSQKNVKTSEEVLLFLFFSFLFLFFF